MCATDCSFSLALWQIGPILLYAWPIRLQVNPGYSPGNVQKSELIQILIGDFMRSIRQKCANRRLAY